MKGDASMVVAREGEALVPLDGLPGLVSLECQQ